MVRGPAITPSFVTWATRKRDAPESFTISINSWQQYLSWLTVPGTEPASGEKRVCIESIMMNEGLSFAIVSVSRERLVEKKKESVSGPDMPSLLALSFTCGDDSSPDT